MYKAASWKLSEDWDQYTAFERALRQVNKTSSPGIPYCKESPTNGKWLKWNGVDADPYQKERLWQAVQDVMRGEYQHKYRVFIKHEMHNEKKAKEKRWRLIIASSLPVQVVWQMLFGELNTLLITKTFTTPSFQGYVPIGGGWKRLRQMLEAYRMKYCIDKSAWDINAPGWVFDLALRLRHELCRNPNLKWFEIAQRLYDDAYKNSVLVFPDGSQYQQQFHGFMKSGIVNTISDNSFAQIFLHIGACQRARIPLGSIIATGDDTIQSLVSDDYLKHLQELGCIVKEVVVGYQFMGFDHNNFHPMYPHKHIANALNQDPRVLPEVIEAYLAWYAHHPHYALWRKVAEDLDYEVQPHFYHKFWLDDPRALDDS